METYTCLPGPLREFCTDLLHGEGLPRGDAELVAASLVDANLRGVDSHGITRLPIYVKRLRRGLIEPQPTVDVVQDAGGALLVDGNNGMGAVVTTRALDLALARVRRHGAVSVAIRNTNHYGSGAFYAHRAIAHQAAVFLYANAPATMAPWGGVQPYLGTNPYTFGIPAGRRDPMILDMATSQEARGKIILAAERGEPIPSGWATDPDGNPTTDAASALAGSVQPFGGPKGYGIALMIEVMAGVLTGASFGPHIGDLYHDLNRPQDLGAFIQLVDVAAFIPRDRFIERMDTLIDEIKTSPAQAGVEEILVPGEPEAQTARRRARGGIPLPTSLLTTLDELTEGRTPRLSHVVTAPDQ